MRPNVKQFMQLLSETAVFPAPVVDIGSLRTEGQEAYADLRPFFERAAYTGFDMRHGAGVDCVGTIHRLPLASRSVGTVILLDTLEHVLDPLAALEEVTRVLRPGGVVVISSHMNFPIHAHPSDYWRFTPMMFDYLMRRLGERHVFAQGDAENPHTVIGVGSMASPGDDGAWRLRSAVQSVQDFWPEDSFGGQLFPAHPLRLDIEQRHSDRDLPSPLAGHRLFQSFICQQDGLARVDVLLARPDGPSLRHLLFTLQDESSGADVAVFRLFALQVVEGTWVSIPVTPQADSRGKRYVLTISSPDAGERETVTVKGSVTNVRADTHLTIDGEAVDGSICFKTYCAPAGGSGLDPWAPFETPHDASMTENPVPAPSSDDVARRAIAADDQAWHHSRNLAAIQAAQIDGLREQLRSQHADLIALQRQLVDQSAESASILRSLRDNPAARAWRRVRGKGVGGGSD